MAPRGRSEGFDRSRRAAEIEHVGHGTAASNTPGRYEAEKGRVYAVKEERPSLSSCLQAARYGFALYQRLRQENPGRWLSRREEAGWMDGCSAETRDR
jgi:hypothetical protein